MTSQVSGVDGLARGRARGRARRGRGAKPDGRGAKPDGRRGRSRAGREAGRVRERERRRPHRAITATLRSVTDLTEAAVVRRVPILLDERLRVLSRRQPVTVPPHTSLADCLVAIQRTGTGDSVFVCDDAGRLLGVLTERDIFGRIVAGHVDLGGPVESLMTTDPRTLELDATIRDAIELMQTGRYRNVPVVDDDGTLVGVIRQADIIKYLAESFPEELLNLPPRPHQRMKEQDGA